MMKKFKKVLPINEIISLYCDSQWSMVSLSKKYNVGVGTIKSRLVESSVILRNYRIKRDIDKQKFWESRHTLKINKDELEKLYLVDLLSPKDIGDMFNVSKDVVRIHLKKYGIKLRNPSESRTKMVLNKIGLANRGRHWKLEIPDEFKKYYDNNYIPQKGDVARGADIGMNNKSGKFIYWDCEDCHTLRWVLIRNGKPRSKRCSICKSKSIEFINIIREKAKIRARSSEHISRFKNMVEQKWNDAEYKEKMSSVSKRVHTGVIFTDDTKNKISMKVKLAHSDINYRIKESNIKKKLWENLEYYKMMCESRKGRIITEEQKRKQSITAKITWNNQSDDFKKRHAELSRNRWLDSNYRDKTVRNVLKASYSRPNKVEDKVIQAIELSKLPMIYNGIFGGLLIEGKCPDFIDVNGVKAIVEVFGNYWHRNDDGESRKNIFKKYGYKTLILWENHINESTVEEIGKEIKDFIST